MIVIAGFVELWNIMWQMIIQSGILSFCNRSIIPGSPTINIAATVTAMRKGENRRKVKYFTRILYVVEEFTEQLPLQVPSHQSTTSVM